MSGILPGGYDAELAGSARPSVSVVTGNPAPEEIAALLAVLAASTPGSEAAAEGFDPTPGGAWRDRGRLLGARPQAGPDSWRWSART